MREQRVTLRLLQYWELIRKGRDIPEIHVLNPTAIEDIWPYCFRVKVEGAAPNLSYKYEYLGEPIAKLYGRDLTSQTVDQNMTQFPGGVIHKQLGGVITNPSPQHHDGHFVSDGNKLIKYRACLLPFGNKEKVTHIVTGLSCRFFT